MAGPAKRKDSENSVTKPKGKTTQSPGKPGAAPPPKNKDGKSPAPESSGKDGAKPSPKSGAAPLKKKESKTSVGKRWTRDSQRSILKPSYGRGSMNASIHSTAGYAENWIVIPPDGGWGWVVVAAAFVINFIIDGTTYCFGIFLDDISVSFDVHPTKVALANSLMSGFYYFAGPLGCGLCNRWGFRIVGSIGAILSAGVFVAATYIDDINLFLFIVGFCGGVSFNLVYTPTILVVGFYFDRWRALATSISVTGTSVGIMTFPIILNKLLKDFDWRGQFRILAIACASSVTLMMTFKPITPTRVMEIKKIPIDTSSTDEEADSIGTFHIEETEDDTFSIKRIWQDFHNKLYPTVAPRGSVTTVVSRRHDFDVRSAYTGAQSDRSFPMNSVFRGVTDRDARSVGLSTVYENYEDDDRPRYCCWCFQGCGCCSRCCLCKRHCCEDRNLNRPMYKDDIFYTGSVRTLPEYRNKAAAAATGVASTRAHKEQSVLSYHMSVSRVITPRELEETRGCVCCPEAMVRVLVTMLDMRLLRSPSFLMLVISGFLTMVGLYSPFVFITQRGAELGFSPDWCSMLLTIMGVANTVGRIICGVISAIPHVDTLSISWVTLMIAGATTMTCSFIGGLEAQIAFAVVFGLMMASFTALRAAVVADMMGLENLTNAFGINIMFYGIGSFVGIPAAGYLVVVTGHYAYSFLFAGAAILLSGLLLIPIKRTMAWEQSKKKKVTFKK